MQFFFQLTFCNKIIEHAHCDTKLEELPQVRGEFLEARQNRQLLPHIALIECNLFGIRDEPAVDIAIFAFEFLLLNRQIASWSTQMRKHDTREEQIEDDDSRRLHADGRCCSVNVDDDIEERLASVRVEISHTLAEFVDVCGEQLVCICNTIIQV